AQRDRAAFFVVPPDRVEVRGGDFLDQPLLQEALADVADSSALEAGGDGEHCPVLARAGGGQDDGLGVGKLNLGHGGRLLDRGRAIAALLRPQARLAAGRLPRGKRYSAYSPSRNAMSVISRSLAR